MFQIMNKTDFLAILKLYLISTIWWHVWQYKYGNMVIQIKNPMSYLHNQNILQRKTAKQLMKCKTTKTKYKCVVEASAPVKHLNTNLASEIGQLIPSYDFDIVCWFVILGGHTEETSWPSQPGCSFNFVLQLLLKNLESSLNCQNMSTLHSDTLNTTPSALAHFWWKIITLLY